MARRTPAEGCARVSALAGSAWEADAEFIRAAQERQRNDEIAQEALVAAFEVTDPDFKALAIDLAFTVGGVPSNPEYPDQVVGSETCDDEWCVIADDIDIGDNQETNRRLVEALVDEIKPSLVPWIIRFADMGCVRADDRFSPKLGNRATTFYLVVSSADFDDRLRDLASWPVIASPLVAVPGAWLEVRGSARPINASKLHEALLIPNDYPWWWGGPGTPSRLPAPGEERAEWLSRVAIDKAGLDAILDRWKAVGRDPDLYDLFGTADERSAGAEGSVAWLVEGRLPRGQITSLVGNSQAGKSSLAHEIASALGCIEKTTPEPRTVLGQPIEGSYMVALLTGEDSAHTVAYRQERHATIWGRSRTMPLDGIARPFVEWLEALEQMPRLDLLIVDPVRAFLDGDEDSSRVVSEFYDRLLRLARSKHCAVLVVHHLTKGRPRSLADMPKMVRGSGVHIDRPRLVWGMRDLGGGLVEIGPINSNFAEEEIGWAVNAGRVYRRDASTFTLRPLHTGAEQERQAADAPQLVLAAVGRLNAEGSICRRSGKCGLFELRAPELIGLSRAAVLSAIGTLAEQGLLTDGEGGLVVVR